MVLNTGIFCALICAFIAGLAIGVHVKAKEEALAGKFIMNTKPGAEHLFELYFDHDLNEFIDKKYVCFIVEKR